MSKHTSLDGNRPSPSYGPSCGEPRKDSREPNAQNNFEYRRCDSHPFVSSGFFFGKRCLKGLCYIIILSALTFVGGLKLGVTARQGALETDRAASKGDNANAWATYMEKFNVPLVHGSGVYVDLGNTKTLKNKPYREPGGQCPVWGKYIKPFQPTSDPAIWPNDYLKPVPYAKSQQDRKPLGGGFGLPIPNSSPKTLEELKNLVAEAKKNDTLSDYAKQFIDHVNDDLGHCAFYARMTSAAESPKTGQQRPKEEEYRYSMVYDEVSQLCTLLYINMQEMTGAGTYCKRGDDGPNLSWYCFQPEKEVTYKTRVWGSPYVRLDHATACPRGGLKDVHWGQWNGKKCQRIAVRKRIAVQDAADCAVQLFKNSPSDNPTKYVGDEGRGWDQIDKNFPGVLFPAGSTGSDQPHSRGVGVNWANYYVNGKICEMYDGAPNCLTQAGGQYAFVSLASPDPNDAVMPPCKPGAVIAGLCTCPQGSSTGTSKGKKCVDEHWVEGDVSCECTPQNKPGPENEPEGSKFNIWLVAGPGIALAVLIAAGLIYWFTRRRAKPEPPEAPPRIEDETKEHAVQPRKTQADLLQEAEPSFWGEAEDDDPTNVLFDQDQMDKDF
ncbi:apical membrane antigen 1 domain-containing protein [Cystoisospora suis]|uniref:Apical membrane antigen 1 domain-containing protein n=1 Tax=Cystoisospora suis TaxID=483139 RepID=A0A2C6KLY7_9APIC|nr:apical membrane antigen 1 domain-containing protein [Cystoisospora suis]